jgi:hypothetical protein
MKKVIFALAATLALSAGAASAAPKSSGGFSTFVSGGLAIKSCTDKVRDRLNISAGRTLNMEHMNADNPPAPGVWDVRFKGFTTETGSQKTTAIAGVCHIRPDRPTTVELESR